MFGTQGKGAGDGYSPQLTKKKVDKAIFTISSTIVMPFSLARLSKNFLVRGGCAQYCTANSIMVVTAAVERVLEAAPPIIAMGFTFSAVFDVRGENALFWPYTAMGRANLLAGRELRALVVS